MSLNDAKSTALDVHEGMEEDGIPVIDLLDCMAEAIKLSFCTSNKMEMVTALNALYYTKGNRIDLIRPSALICGHSPISVAGLREDFGRNSKVAQVVEDIFSKPSGEKLENAMRDVRTLLSDEQNEDARDWEVQTAVLATWAKELGPEAQVILLADMAVRSGTSADFRRYQIEKGLGEVIQNVAPELYEKYLRNEEKVAAAAMIRQDEIMRADLMRVLARSVQDDELNAFKFMMMTEHSSEYPTFLQQIFLQKKDETYAMLLKSANATLGAYPLAQQMEVLEDNKERDSFEKAYTILGALVKKAQRETVFMDKIGSREYQ